MFHDAARDHQGQVRLGGQGAYPPIVRYRAGDVLRRSRPYANNRLTHIGRSRDAPRSGDSTVIRTAEQRIRMLSTGQPAQRSPHSHILLRSLLAPCRSAVRLCASFPFATAKSEFGRTPSRSALNTKAAKKPRTTRPAFFALRRHGVALSFSRPHRARRQSVCSVSRRIQAQKPAVRAA
jgi:hypothetical protein